MIHTLCCTVPTGPGREIYKVGAGGEKGREGGEKKLYCQASAPSTLCSLALHYNDNFALNYGL